MSRMGRFMLGALWSTVVVAFGVAATALALVLLIVVCGLIGLLVGAV